MFRRLDSHNKTELQFQFEGQTVSARVGDTVAAALLAAGIVQFRLTPKSDQPRAPFCLMGACFDCLVYVDGENLQACMIMVENGMRLERAERSKGPQDD